MWGALIWETRAQCFTQNILGTVTGSVELKQQDYDMKDLMGALLDLLNTAKKGKFCETQR